jgi:hypothetical protein
VQNLDNVLGKVFGPVQGVHRGQTDVVPLLDGGGEFRSQRIPLGGYDGQDLHFAGLDVLLGGAHGGLDDVEMLSLQRREFFRLAAGIDELELRAVAAISVPATKLLTEPNCTPKTIFPGLFFASLTRSSRVFHGESVLAAMVWLTCAIVATGTKSLKEYSYLPL